MQDPVRFDTPTVASRDATRSQLANSLVFELQQMAALLQTALAEEERRAIVRSLLILNTRCSPDRCEADTTIFRKQFLA